MNNKFYYALVTALALFFCAVAYCFAQEGTYMGTCVRVLDGDTVTVADENQNLHRIRIIGLDAPELAQPYGRAAKEALAGLILHKEIHVLPAGVDKYDRELAVLRIDSVVGQVDVAEMMISNGHAFSYGGQHYKAQEYAAERHLGVWSDVRYQERPWLYRRRMALSQGPTTN